MKEKFVLTKEELERAEKTEILTKEEAKDRLIENLIQKLFETGAQYYGDCFDMSEKYNLLSELGFSSNDICYYKEKRPDLF